MTSLDWFEGILRLPPLTYAQKQVFEALESRHSLFRDTKRERQEEKRAWHRDNICYLQSLGWRFSLTDDGLLAATMPH